MKRDSFFFLMTKKKKTHTHTHTHTKHDQSKASLFQSNDRFGN